MKDERKLGAILGYVHLGLHAVIQLVYVPLLLGAIGQSEFGLYQIASSIMAYITVMETTLASSVLRYYSLYLADQATEKIENLLFVSRKIFRWISIFVIVCAICIAPVIRQFYQGSFSTHEQNEIAAIFVVLMGNLVITLNSNIYVASISANQKYIFLKIVGILSLLLQPIAVILCVYRHPYAIVIAIIQVAISAGVAVIRWWYCKKTLRIVIQKHYNIDPGLTKNLFIFSLGILFTTLADQIFWRTDQIIIGKMIGSQAVAVYSVGSQLFNMYLSLAAGIGSVLLPTIVIRVKKDGIEGVDPFFRKVGRLQMFILGAVASGIVSFGKEFLILWVGNDYMEAYYVAVFLILPYTIDVIQGAGLSILQAVNRYQYRGKCMLIIAIINIGLTMMMVKYMGIIGAAFATAISIIIGPGIIMNRYYQNEIGLKISSFWKEVLPIVAMNMTMMVFGAILARIQVNSIAISFTIHILCFIMVYCGASYLIMNTWERNQITTVVKRISTKVFRNMSS